ncbi:MAG: radical SAM protein [Deltaproteobacteria bacterium]|nr:radical SAM protein [Deltaproteobacteria bacterium]
MAGSNGNGNGDGGSERDDKPETGRHTALGGTMAMLRRHGAAYLRQQAGGRPRILELQVTRSCNARCAWCDAWRAPGNDTELDDYAAMVRLIRPLGVALVGGEPLLRPDLERLAAALRLSTEISALTVATNGLDLTADRARRLFDAGVDKLVISIEGLGEENDRVRRRVGLFAQLDRVLPEVVAVGFRAVQLQVTIQERSIPQLVEAARYGRERGVRVSYTLEGPTRLETQLLSTDEKLLGRLEDEVERLCELAERWTHVVSSPEYLRRVVAFLRRRTEDFPPCAAGTQFLRATPDGWIRPCGSLPPLGHWTGYPFPPSSLSCSGCWSRLRGETPTLLGVSQLVELYRSAGADPG